MAITAKVVTPPEVSGKVVSSSASKTVGIQDVSKTQDSFSIDASEIPISLDNSSAKNVRDALNETAIASGAQTFTNKTINADNNTIGRKIAVFYDNRRKGVYTIVKIDGNTVEVEGEIIKGARGDCAVEYDYPLLEPRFTCNAYIDSAQEAYRLLQQFAKIFNAITYWSSGSVFFSQDKQKDPVMIFTNANVSDGEGFAYSSKRRSDMFTTCRIKYVDKFDDFQPRVEYVEDPEAINKYGIIETEIDGFGITSKGQAYRAAKYLIANSQLETEMIQFSTKMEGAYLRPGDVFNVMDSIKTTHRYGGTIKKIGEISTKKNPRQAIIELDFPIHSIVNEDEEGTWLRMMCFNPEKNQTLASLDLSEDGVSLGKIDELRQAQVGEFVVRSANDDSAAVGLYENRYRFVLGEFTSAEATSDAASKGVELATDPSEISLSILKVAANGKRLRLNEGRMIDRDGTLQDCPDDMEIDGYCYIQKLGESINKLQEGYIWIVENTSVGTETEFKQYRTVSVSEKEEGIYGITGVKYIDSKYNYLEKGMELQKTYNGPPITVPSPNPPKKCNFSCYK